MRRNYRKALLVPMVLLFTMLMAISVYAKPKLSRKTALLYKRESSYDGSVNIVLEDSMTVKGVSKKAKIVAKSVSTPDITLMTWKVGGKLEVFPAATQILDADGNYVKDADVTPGVYTASVTVKDKKKTTTLPFTIAVSEFAPNRVAWIKVGKTKLSAPFAQPNKGVIRMDLPVGKKVKLNYKPLKGYKKTGIYITHGSSKEKKVKGAVKLRHGDVIHLRVFKKGWSKDDEVAVVVN